MVARGSSRGGKGGGGRGRQSGAKRGGSKQRSSSGGGRGGARQSGRGKSFNDAIKALNQARGSANFGAIRERRRREDNPDSSGTGGSSGFDRQRGRRGVRGGRGGGRGVSRGDSRGRGASYDSRGRGASYDSRGRGASYDSRGRGAAHDSRGRGRGGVARGRGLSRDDRYSNRNSTDPANVSRDNNVPALDGKSDTPQSRGKVRTSEMQRPVRSGTPDGTERKRAHTEQTSISFDEKDGESKKDLSISQLRKDAKRRKLEKVQTWKYTYTSQLNKLYGELLTVCNKETVEGDKPKVVTKILSHIATGPNGVVKSLSVERFASQFMPMREKPAVCRALQMCLKHGSITQRRFIEESCQDMFIELCGGAKSHKFAMKLLLYCPKDLGLEFASRILEPTNRDLLFSKYGAAVWEYIFSNKRATTSLQRHVINSICIPRKIQLEVQDWRDVNFDSLYSRLSPSDQILVKEHVEHVLERAADKELFNRTHFHVILRSFVGLLDSKEAVSDWMERVHLAFGTLSTTRAGVMAMLPLMSAATAKQRRKILQVVKTTTGGADKWAVNPVCYLLLVRLLLTVDDTRALTDVIIKPILANLEEVVSSKFGRKVLRVVVAGELTPHFSIEEKRLLGAASHTSMKDGTARAKELQDAVQKFKDLDSVKSLLQEHQRASVLEAANRHA